MLTELGFITIAGITNSEEEWKKDSRIILGDMHDTVFTKATFTYLYSKEVLEHTPAPFVALCEMNRIMVAGGEFYHLISCGLEKQREMYHVSCFPDWLWYDLFKKTGFEVLEIHEGHPTEIGFYGRKVADVQYGVVPEKWSYDLNGEMNAIRRVPLVI